MLFNRHIEDLNVNKNEVLLFLLEISYLKEWSRIKCLGKDIKNFYSDRIHLAIWTKNNNLKWKEWILNFIQNGPFLNWWKWNRKHINSKNFLMPT